MFTSETWYAIELWCSASTRTFLCKIFLSNIAVLENTRQYQKKFVKFIKLNYTYIIFITMGFNVTKILYGALKVNLYRLCLILQVLEIYFLLKN